MSDPRRHPFVRSFEGDRITYRCGCVNEVDPGSGFLRCAEKCAGHRAGARDPAGLDEAYYRELGTLAGETAHVAELAEALGPFPRAADPGRSRALEVGCGISPYVEAIRAAGHHYTGLDPSRWACEAMREHQGAAMLASGLTVALAANFVGGFDLVLAAHCLEHLPDGPGGIGLCAVMLRKGGELWIVVPDDSDPLNPDHLFFFTMDTLRSCIERAGLTVERMVMRKYVEHENFIYCRAKKPG